MLSWLHIKTDLSLLLLSLFIFLFLMMVIFNYTQVILLNFIATFVTAHRDLVYVHGIRNSSVHISCESTITEGQPFAFSLKRRFLQSRQVLYLSKGLPPSITNSKDKDRITVLDELNNHRVQLNISQLHGWDTDVYSCEFHYAGIPHFKNIPGKMEFFIYAQEPCSCLSYGPLLYVISGAACLLGVLVVILSGAYCCKRPNRSKPQPVVPVYEEMSGVWPTNIKANRHHMDITKSEESNHLSTFLSNENYYVKTDST